jgi:hypothetical protein
VGTRFAGAASDVHRLRTYRLALPSMQGLGECPPVAPRSFLFLNADDTGLVPSIFIDFLRATPFAHYATNLVILSKVYLPIPVRLNPYIFRALIPPPASVHTEQRSRAS